MRRGLIIESYDIRLGGLNLVATKLAFARDRCAPGVRVIAACAAIALLGAAASARAADPASAEVLFREGRRLLEEERLLEACPKFEQSQRLDPSSGTLLNLALCHEKQGRLATAWAEYLMAARLARAQNLVDRAGVAEQHASQLEPQLSYLTVSVVSPVPGMSIRRGGAEVDMSTLGSRLPVDPGEHVLSVTAPGYEAVELKIRIEPRGDAQTVVIPALQKKSARSSGPARPRESAPLAAEQAKTPVVGWVIGGAGVAALGIGGMVGAFALDNYAEADDACPTHRDCSENAMETRERAETQANVSNIVMGAGLIGVGVGVYLVLTSSSRASSSTPAQGMLRLTPFADGKATGLFARTTF